MKQFEFTLQAVYDMQESDEKQIKMQLNALEAEIIRRKEEIETVNVSFENAQIEYFGAMSGGVEAIRIRNYGNFFEKLRHILLLQYSKIKQLEKEKDKLMQKLVRIRKDKMLLNKLRDEQYSEFKAELKKQQANLMDDFVSYSVNRA